MIVIRVFLWLCLTSVWAGHAWASLPVRIGISTPLSLEEALAKWTPTAEYLHREIPEYTFQIVPLSSDSIEKAVANQEIEFLLTDPASFVSLRGYGLSDILTLRNKRLGGAYAMFGAVIFTRANVSDIERIQDLKGKIFMAVHPDSFDGWWAAWREMKTQGINPQADFVNIKFGGFPQDQVVMAVKNGEVDAGTVRTDIIEQMVADGRVAMEDFRILNRKHTPGFPFMHSTPLYPEWPLARLRHTSVSLSESVVIALLNISRDHPAAVAAEITGWTVPLDYAAVHALMKDLKIAPYHDGHAQSPALNGSQIGWGLVTVITILFAGSIMYVIYLNRNLMMSKVSLEAEISERKRAEDELVRLGLTIDQSVNEIYMFDDQNLYFVKVNKGAMENLGYTSEQFEHLRPVDLMPEFTLETYRQMLQPLENGQSRQVQFTSHQKRKDGTQYPVEVHLHKSNYQNRSVYVAVLFDITKRIQTEQALMRERQLARITLESIGDGIITTDAQGHVEFINPVAEQMTGWKYEEIHQQPFMDVIRLVDEETGNVVEDPIKRCLREGRFNGFNSRNLLIGKDGMRIAVQETVTPRVDEDGTVAGVVLAFRDVTEVRQLERYMAYHASHDDLTGLLNRREFENQLSAALRSARLEHKHHALLYMDLDQFKVVNDTCGHMGGDQLLKRLTSQLRALVRESDSLARLGGDEFGILLMGCDMPNAEKMANKVRQEVHDFRFTWEGQNFQVGVSIGVAAISAESGSLAEVLSAADAACYVAKETGRNRVHVYSTDDEALRAHQGQIQWVQKVRNALSEDRFCLYGQPIVSLKDITELVQIEVLLRMRDPDGKIVNPAAFIPAAERFQLMPEIDRYVVDQTLKFIKKAGEKLAGQTVFSINLSGQSLCEEGFMYYLADLIEGSGLPADRFCFEITETAAIANFRYASRLLAVLHSMGCKLSLDDFGSGLSSFSYLKNFRADFLKIDGSFVRNMNKDLKDYTLVQAINNIGQMMSMKTIAEFVEDIDIIAKLREIGVDYAQGYGIGRPRPLQEFLSSLDDKRKVEKE
jgi:diguanylate cyclase (GGDEF)-like protein/PAS domain S-box-containing protein